MTCAECIAVVPRLARLEATGTEVMAAARHLLDCPACRPRFERASVEMRSVELTPSDRKLRDGIRAIIARRRNDPEA